MYYAVSTLGTRNSSIGYATSPTMELNTWTDHGSTNITSHGAGGSYAVSPYNAIDPALIHAGDKTYMFFGSYWNDLYRVEMNANLTAPLNDLASSAVQVEYQPAGSHAAEAAFVFRYQPPGSSVPYFYLFWSEGQANNYNKNKPAAGGEYKVRVCRSTSVDGQYVDASGQSCLNGYGELVLASHDLVYGPGAQGVIDTDNGPVLYYRYGKPLVPQVLLL